MATKLMTSALAPAVMIAGSWVAAVGVRSVWSRLAAQHSPGTKITLGSIPGVLESEPRLWRGPTPPPDGYGELAASGVGLIVDLRSEADVAAVNTRVKAAGMRLLSLPTDNAGVPDATFLNAFSTQHRAHAKITYVHCEAGEGRTGAIVGAYQVRSGREIAPVVSEQLAVGSLTIAQMAYIATKGRRPLLSTMIDRTIDRPTERLFDLIR